MKCNWYVQSNLNAIESDKIIKACDGYGINVVPFKVRPFTTSMERINAVSPFILIGSTTLNYKALKSRKYRKGIFFNNNFKPTIYQAGYGDDFLNHDLKRYAIKDINEDLYGLDENVFIRSNDDTKNISGGTCYFKELLDIKLNTETHWVNGDIFTPDSEICIASVKEIYAEYRIIVCNKTIVGCSRYRPSIHYSVPDDVINFANQMINKWEPHDVYVVDICETDAGLKVIECNCVNGSGWYDSNYGEVVYALSKYQEEKELN